VRSDGIHRPENRVIQNIRDILATLGVDHLLRHGNRYRIVTIAYHGVTPDGPDPFDFFVELEQFDWQIGHLTKHFEVRPLHEWMTDPDPQVKMGAAVTIDDGYANVLEHGLPVLEKYKCPATVYLCPGAIESRRLLWFDRLQEILRSAGRLRDWPQLVERLKQDPIDKIEEQLAELGGNNENAACGNHPGKRLLDWNEIDSLRQSGLITFGAHTMNHTILTPLSPADQRHEIEESCRQVAKRTGSCLTFAYPNGLKDDFSDLSVRILSDSNLLGAVTGIPGLADTRTDLFRWPRLPVGNSVCDKHFIMYTSGLFSTGPR
jgi:peptidoglycan/xylan/chitin deacetylase (PgdA/CDA1 family)